MSLNSNSTPENRNLTSACKTLLLSSGVISSTACIILVKDESSITISMLVSSLIICAKNELQQNRNRTSNDKIEKLPSGETTGLIALTKEKINSVGVPYLLQSAIFTPQSIVALNSGDPVKSFCFLLYGIGCLATAHALNNNQLKNELREPTKVELLTAQVWSKINLRIQNVLKNPGVSLATGTVLLNVQGILRSSIVQSTPQVIITGLGLTICAHGILNGLKPLIGKKLVVTGDSSITGGIGRLALGLSSILAESYGVGIATVLFGIASIRTGIIMKPDFYSKLWKKLKPETKKEQVQ